MSIETDLVTALNSDATVAALISDRVFPLVVPQDVTRPAIAYLVVSQPREYSHSGAADFAFTRIQLTCEGTTYANAKALIAAVKAVVHAWGWMIANERDSYSDGFQYPVVRLDITKHHRE